MTPVLLYLCFAAFGIKCHLTIEDLQNYKFLFYWNKNETPQHLLACFSCCLIIWKGLYPLGWFSWTNSELWCLFFINVGPACVKTHILFGTVKSVWTGGGQPIFSGKTISPPRPIWKPARKVSRNVILSFQVRGKWWTKKRKEHFGGWIFYREKF